MTACDGSSDSPDMPDNPSLPESPTLPDDNKHEDNNDSTKTQTMKVNITLNNQTITATLIDNAAAEDLYSRLPLEVTLNDFNNTTEKIFYPEPALNIDGVTRGYAPTPGDITIYIPWGNVAIFCKSWSHSNDLIKIGHIDNDGIQALRVGGDIKIVIEKSM